MSPVNIFQAYSVKRYVGYDNCFECNAPIRGKHVVEIGFWDARDPNTERHEAFICHSCARTHSHPFVRGRAEYIDQNNFQWETRP